MAPASKILIAAPFHHLESSLASRVRRLGGGDPLAHRRVVVISNRLRGHVEKVLARAGGFAGVSVLGMIDLAREITEPECVSGGSGGFIRPSPKCWRRRRSRARRENSSFFALLPEDTERASTPR